MMKEGSKVEIIVVMLSVAILSVALLMLMVVFQSTIKFKIPPSPITTLPVEPSTTVLGTWVYINTFTNIINQTDGNVFIYGREESIWSGTFVGTSYDIFTGTRYLSGPMNFDGQIDFNGKVNDKVGTLIILFLGQAIRRARLWVSGQWSILSGTGDLTNLHGEGYFWGWEGDLEYTGQIYFE